jgi:hypothetical protein
MVGCCAPAKDASCSLPQSKPGVCSCCNAKGRPVATLTVKSLVRDHTRVPAVASFSFCPTPDCETVYFSERAIFQKPDLKVRVGVKEQGDPIPVCYCFDYARAEICREIEKFGNTEIPERIKAEIQAGFCACEVKNPAGKCCLGNVSQVIQECLRAMEERNTASAH